MAGIGFTDAQLKVRQMLAVIVMHRITVIASSTRGCLGARTLTQPRNVHKTTLFRAHLQNSSSALNTGTAKQSLDHG